jgi:hypothetical protein
LRDAVTAALTAALPPSAGEVFPFRVWPIDPADLPLVAVATPGDDASRASPDADPDDPETMERTVDLRVTAYATASEATLDATLDAISREVEVILGSGATVGGKIVKLDYQGAVLAYEGGDQPYGSVQMRWFAELIHTADAPDVLIA